MYLYIVIVSLIMYFGLQYMDEQRNIRLHKPPTSTGMRITFLFFSFVITSVCFHLFWNNTEDSISGGDASYTAVENQHLKHIHQEVEVGLPEF